MRHFAYEAIRDDTGVKSLSVNERDFLRECALASVQDGRDSLRLDGRTQNDVRKVKVALGRWDNGAECTIQWGSGTRVTSSICGELVPPNPDRPSEGMVEFSVDISPMAGTGFRLAPPVSSGSGSAGIGSSASSKRGVRNYSDRDQRLQSNRILRCLERIILTGGALDREALAVLPGQWVWRLSINVTVLDDAGNILDASILAAVASIRHYRRPEVDLTKQVDDTMMTGDQISSNDRNQPRVLPQLVSSAVKEPTPLPLHHTPLSLSFALIPEQDAVHAASTTSVAALIDPTDREELVQAGSLTIAMNIHSEVCLLDYGGGCELTPEKLKECWKLAEGSIKQLCRLLEETLSKSDGTAQSSLLERLKQQQQSTKGSANAVPAFLQSDGAVVDETDGDDAMMGDEDGDAQQIQKAELQAEAEYRRQALDFSTGHVAQKVREDDDVGPGGNRSRTNAGSAVQAGSLLASLLKNAKSSNDTKTATADGAAQASAKASTDEQRVKKDTSAKKRKTNAKAEEPAGTQPMTLDSDEDEDTTTILKSEFN